MKLKIELTGIENRQGAVELLREITTDVLLGSTLSETITSADGKLMAKWSITPEVENR